VSGHTREELILNSSIFFGAFATPLRVVFLLLWGAFGSWYWIKRLRTEAPKKVATPLVSLLVGFFFFLVSELCLFRSFLASFLHRMMSPDLSTRGFPNARVFIIDCNRLALGNTAILLISRYSASMGYHFCSMGHSGYGVFGMFISLFWAILFTCNQLCEYFYSPTAIYARLYAALFYLITGFHRAHVIVRTSFLMLVTWSIFSCELGEEIPPFAFMYWHMVDGVWALVYFLVYRWAVVESDLVEPEAKQ
jgi:heme/copper-type cytochrome/quinol oxidase subunit 3